MAFKNDILNVEELKSEQKEIYARMFSIKDKTSPEYKACLDRIEQIHRIVDEDRKTCKGPEILKIIGWIGLGATGLYLANRNDKSDNPPFNKETKHAADSLFTHGLK